MCVCAIVRVAHSATFTVWHGLYAELGLVHAVDQHQRVVLRQLIARPLERSAPIAGVSSDERARPEKRKALGGGTTLPFALLGAIDRYDVLGQVAPLLLDALLLLVLNCCYHKWYAHC